MIIETPKEIIENYFENKISALKTSIICKVVDINKDNMTISIKPLNENIQYNDVEIGGIGLSNGSGIIKLPNLNDFVLCTFQKSSKIPIMVCSLYDVYTNIPDNKIKIDTNELFINSKNNGSYIFIKKDNTINIKTNSGIGLTLLSNGQIKLENYTFPLNDGTAGQVLKTDGSGNLYWGDDIDT